MLIWYWFALAAALLIFEMLLPAFYLIFFGAAAFATGLLTSLFKMSWQMEFSLFTFLSAALVLLAKRMNFYKPQLTSHPHLNKVMHSYLGKEYQLFTAIKNGEGQVKIGDSLWSVTGAEMEMGKTVRLIAINENAFTVIAAD